MRYSSVLTLILILYIFPVKSQDNDYGTASKGDLYLKLRNISFIKNNEYSNPITEGYTLIGFFFQPALVYQPDEKVTLQFGTHLVSYSGTNRFSVIKPVFSTTWNFSENTYFTIGSISGSDDHHMFDPHYSKERTYSTFQEEGLQFRTVTDHFFSDCWLSWENYIFKGDTDREIFTAGESFRYSSSDIGDLFRIEIPFQVQFKHYGGQISNYPEGVETYLNIAAGIKANVDIKRSRYGSAGFEGLFFAGNSMTGNAPSGIQNGFAGWYKIFYSLKSLEFETGFWQSHNFYAPNGNTIFSSVSDHYENLTISDRKLITGSIQINLSYKEFLDFYFGFDGYYDTDLERFDNALTLHLRFDKLLKLASLNN